MLALVVVDFDMTFFLNQNSNGTVWSPELYDFILFPIQTTPSFLHLMISFNPSSFNICERSRSLQKESE